jgi:hypothetical protein
MTTRKYSVRIIDQRVIDAADPVEAARKFVEWINKVQLFEVTDATGHPSEWESYAVDVAKGTAQTGRAAKARLTRARRRTKYIPGVGIRYVE